ncbi:ATP-binding protein [Luteipulveratus mongoliensis]|uniref:Bacterial transcriptional activator domain-containing protein n=1 Tax=Luteipulveratus mongoliensis TaxID=571913 RepID=A0A0K1JLI4_9MICO|nr:BTAD domain-containing putative transcriptional regulator [Luteipulveratus mongoliensis]AKU17435.1 hypothetical protein VV02_18940 [Luteipulveratus mongoliensis]
MTTTLTLLSQVGYRSTEIASPQLRQLLALLAQDLRTGASTTRLVDGLWPDDRPAKPTKALQVLVSRARSVLGHETIVSTPTGYRLDLALDEVDVTAVELSANAGVRAAREGDHDLALKHAEAGLALWNGSPAGLQDATGPLGALRAERSQTYASLCRLQALSLARLSRFEEALPALRELSEEHSRDEELLQELLHAEAATTGPAAALERYESYRRRLRDDLGTDPGSALQAVQRELLNGEAPTVRAGIPHEPNALLGRDDDLDAVAALVRSSRVTSIVGPGGLGKTRLANVVSRRAQQRVVHLVGLAGVSTDEGVLAEVASVLGVRDARVRPGTARLTAPRDVLTGIVEALGPTPSLLVLDNCEHVVQGVADVVRALVSMSPDVRVLTTSRAPLGLSSESVYLLPELDLRTSVELFGQRARAARPDVDLPAETVERLCRALDGLPLAVELAAARTRVMSVAQIEQRLTDRFALLRGGARDAPARHQTLLAVIDWSWNLLHDDEQSALAALSIFPDGFTLDAADAVLGIDSMLVLEQLIAQSLLKIVESAAGSRFRMLETVREFGAIQLTSTGRSTAVRADFLSWAREVGRRHSPILVGPAPYASLDLLRTEQDNLVAAMRLATEDEDARTVAAVFAALGTMWTMESTHTRAVSFAAPVASVLSHASVAREDLEITRTALVMAASNAIMLADHTAARVFVVLGRLPAPDSITQISIMADLLLQIRELSQVDSPLLRTLTRDENPLVACTAAGIATQTWENEGLVEDALQAARIMVLRLADDTSPWFRAVAHARVGELSLHLGRPDECETEMRKAIPVLERIGAWTDVMQARWTLVLARLQVGDVEGAEEWLERASEHSGEDPFGMRMLDIGVRAEIELVKGNLDDGLRTWRRAVDRVQSIMNGFFQTDPPGLEPWTMSTEAVALAAHARSGRLELVPDLADRLSSKLRTVLAVPDDKRRNFVFLDYPVAGSGLLALGLVALRPGASTADSATGARLVALAEAFSYPRAHPSMKRETNRAVALERNKPAYDEAVSSYAGLSRADLVTEALRLLDQI